ncbi:hypothetical protein [Neisseria bergeri]|uniref:hypothetical protein n=1 Tax=Neisseria bergeri TaxID=1906581 RepID=UPI0027DF7509|nr:hypothetical protein [Neisseria bergeri]
MKRDASAAVCASPKLPAAVGTLPGQGGRDAVYCGISWAVTFLMFKTPFSAMPLAIGIGLMPFETPAGQSIVFQSPIPVVRMV